MKSQRFNHLRLVMLGLSLVATVVHADPIKSAGSNPGMPIVTNAAKAQAIPVNVVNNAAFCGRMRQAFSQYAANNGYDAVQQSRLAMAATVSIVEEFKEGRIADYISVAELSAYSRVPLRGQANDYLPLASFLGNALGLGQNVTLALSAGELRFIPYAQKNAAIVVIAQNAASLTPERAQKVAELAKQSGININIVWVGGRHDDGQALEEARSLAWLASVTGGSFTNLSGQENPCAIEA